MERIDARAVVTDEAYRIDDALLGSPLGSGWRRGAAMLVNGLATGLLGFLQIFWDRNRQAVHDRTAATVVARD